MDLPLWLNHAMDDRVFGFLFQNFEITYTLKSSNSFGSIPKPLANSKIVVNWRFVLPFSILEILLESKSHFAANCLRDSPLFSRMLFRFKPNLS